MHITQGDHSVGYTELPGLSGQHYQSKALRLVSV